MTKNVANPRSIIPASRLWAAVEHIATNWQVWTSDPLQDLATPVSDLVAFPFSSVVIRATHADKSFNAHVRVYDESGLELYRHTLINRVQHKDWVAYVPAWVSPVSLPGEGQQTDVLNKLESQVIELETSLEKLEDELGGIRDQLREVRTRS
jgi:hypothetical protein